MFKILQSPRTVRCSLCSKEIKKGSLRLTANLGSGNFSHHFHLKCFAKEFSKELEILEGFFNPSKRR